MLFSCYSETISVQAVWSSLHSTATFCSSSHSTREWELISVIILALFCYSLTELFFLMVLLPFHTIYVACFWDMITYYSQMAKVFHQTNNFYLCPSNNSPNKSISWLNQRRGHGSSRWTETLSPVAFLQRVPHQPRRNRYWPTCLQIGQAACLGI